MRNLFKPRPTGKRTHILYTGRVSVYHWFVKFRPCFKISGDYIDITFGHCTIFIRIK